MYPIKNPLMLIEMILFDVNSYNISKLQAIIRKILHKYNPNNLYFLLIAQY